MIDSATTKRLVLKIADLARALAELDRIKKNELQAAVSKVYVPKPPADHGIVGGLPLDSQLRDTANENGQTASECNEAMRKYDQLAEAAAAILASPILKSMGDMCETGKVKAKARRDGCRKAAADARAELARRQEAREKAATDAEEAQKLADEIEQVNEKIRKLKATFN